MKNTLLCIHFCLLLCLSFGQTSSTQPSLFRIFDKDSINISLNEEYNLIEDSCAKIIRYAHFDFNEKIFFGPFKDVSKANPNLIVAQGNYNNDGLKDGSFTTYFLNGNLQAKGDFKNNKPNGKWVIYFSDGKQKLIFEAEDDNIKITDAWNAKGEKIIDNGDGKFFIETSGIIWTGKLNNGKPDGIWKAKAINDRTNVEIITEDFKNGQFIKGHNIMAGKYSNESHLPLFNVLDLPFINAERMQITGLHCNESKAKQIVNAQYRNGFSAFSDEIGRVIVPYLDKIDLKPYQTELELIGEISTKGYISVFTYKNPFDEKIASGLARVLRGLPSLEPALIDGKPTTQKIVIRFKFMSGVYQFSYNLLPIDSK